jgi:hypothetical protein
MPHRYRLPPLRDVLSGCWRANRPAQTTLVDGFIRILSESPLPQLANLRDTHAVQAFGDLQRLVDSYFDRFHDVQAILHKPTWAMSLCPPALLTAMACIGALLSDKESDAELSWALGEICSTMITWMVCFPHPRKLLTLTFQGRFGCYKLWRCFIPQCSLPPPNLLFGFRQQATLSECRQVSWYLDRWPTGHGPVEASFCRQLGRERGKYSHF